MIGKIDFFGGGVPAPPAVSHFYKAVKAERVATDIKKSIMGSQSSRHQLNVCSIVHPIIHLSFLRRLHRSFT